MVNSRDTPRFSSDPSGFSTFFEDVEELAHRASLNAAETIRWAIRYAGAESEAWRHVACIAPNHKPAATFEDFKSEVLNCYPHLNINRHYTSTDLERLLDENRGLQDMTHGEFGIFYRWFITYTSYLITCGKLSERERISSYLRGFPQSVRSRILNRLTIKKPDVLPNDGYLFADIHEAVLFVMDTGASNYRDSPTTPAVKQEPVEQGTFSELIKVVSSLAQAFNTSTQGQGYRSAPPLPSANVYSATPGGAAQPPPPEELHVL
jgi:hypothetical protein